jgi:hypothetical protein
LRWVPSACINNLMNTTTRFTVLLRNFSRCVTFDYLVDALRWGDDQGVPYDVHTDGGAVTWTWEMRP